MPDTQIVINPRKPFIPYLTRKERYACIIAHRRAGKSFALIQDINHKALTHKRGNMKVAPLRYAYIAPTRDQAKDIAWQYVMDFLSPIKGCKINQGDLKATLPSRAEIRLYSGENFERMRGLYFDGVVLDEYADIDPIAWSTVIRPCLSDYKGWATFSGTPKGKNQLWDVWNQARENENKKWFHMMLKASESGILDADEIADIKSDVTITGDKYLQEYECDFNIANPGAIFLEEVELARKDGRINNDIMHYAGLPVYTAFDIGLPINTKCWVFQIVGDKIKMLMHLSGNPKINTPHKWVHLLTELGKERGYSYGVHFLPHDGETVWRPVFQDAGFDNTEVLEKSKDAWDYINVAKEDFGRVWISEKECQSGIRGLEFWSTIETKKKAYNSNTPAHDWSSHVCTAFCYAMLAIRRGRTINKAGMHKKGQRRGGVRVRTGSFGSNSGFKGKVIR
jgi:hypothetical protein